MDQVPLPDPILLQSGITNLRVPSSAFLAASSQAAITILRKKPFNFIRFCMISEKRPMISHLRQVLQGDQSAKSGRTSCA
jgi:hypothetical protein